MRVEELELALQSRLTDAELALDVAGDGGDALGHRLPSSRTVAKEPSTHPIHLSSTPILEISPDNDISRKTGRISSERSSAAE